MKNLPVDTPVFWRKRLDEANARGDLHLAVYETGSGHFESIAEAHRRIVQYELRKLPEGAHVLDAGCGYGRASEWVGMHPYLGVDISPDFINEANKRYPDRRGSFQVGNLGALPFPDRAFGLAFCVSIRAMIAGNLGDEAWARIEKELKRVAKDVLILEYTDPTNYSLL